MRTSQPPNLSSPPTGERFRPESVEEILAIAYVLEREAATRYSDLALCMKLVGRSDLANLFSDLAREEQHHVSAVEELALRRLQRMPEIPAAFRWQLPESFGAADRTVVTDALTPYEALVTAVHNEERAFSFWSSVAAETSDSAVREEAKAMARQELLHAAALRMARRRAYRAGGRIQRPVGSRTPESMTAHVVALRRDAGQFLVRTAARLDARGDEMTCALLRFACEEIAAPFPAADTAQLDENGPAAVSADSLAVIFEAVGRIDRIGEEVRNCIELHPELGVRGELPRLARAAAVQVAILNRRLSELEPRLDALVGAAAKVRC